MKKNIRRNIKILLFYCGLCILLFLRVLPVCAEMEEDVSKRDIYITNFASFQKAVEEAQEGDKINLTRNISTSKQVVFRKDVEVTINFNGYLYKYTGSKSAFTVNNGVVNISKMNIKSYNYVFSIGSKGSIKIKDGKSSGYIYNKGYMEIKSGIYNNSGAKKSKKDELIQNKGTLVIENGKFYNTVDNCIYSTNGEVFINGGKYYGKSKFNSKQNFPTILNTKNSYMTIDGDVYVSGKASAIENAGEMIIENGEFYSSSSSALVNLGILTIDDGAFEVGKQKNYPAIYNKSQLIIKSLFASGGLYNYGGTIKIYDGTIQSTAANIVNDKGGSIKVYDGSFYSTNDTCLWNTSGKVTLLGGYFCSKKYNTVCNEEEGIFKMTGGSVVSMSSCAAIVNYGKAYLYGGTALCRGKYAYVINQPGATLKVKRSKIGYYNRISWN